MRIRPTPGVGATHASELGLPPGHVWAARTAVEGFNYLSRGRDVEVKDVYVHGPDPSLPPFGAQPIPLDPRQHGHSEYYELDTTGIRSLTRILLGREDGLLR